MNEEANRTIMLQKDESSPKFVTELSLSLEYR